MTTPDSPKTALELREELAREYGQFVAKEPIDIGGARAFNAGDPVPASHIERGVVSRDAVVGANTKTARSAQNVEG